MEYDDAAANGDAATPVTVSAGSSFSNIDFTLDPGGTVSGAVHASDGVTPLEGIAVGIDGVWVGVCTDASGQYTMSNVPLDVPLTAFAGGNW
ncbi:MAG: hypothetical protein U0521_22360 [Anaerolineae bacterium]